MAKISQSQVSKLKLAMREFKVAEQDSTSLIPMSPSCRLAVVIPVYNESIDMLLRPLLSLAQQQNIDCSEFEVVVLVNNNKEEAEQSSESFLANQKVLFFLDLLIGNRVDFDGIFNKYQDAIQCIVSSGVVIHLLDKSSSSVAENENHVGIAKNFACLELASRFISVPVGVEGIIAMTDCDCRLSQNYIRSILDIFEQYPLLNGLAGKLGYEVDPQLPNGDEIRDIFTATIGGSRNPLFKAGESDRIIFRQQCGGLRPLLNCGSNIVIPLRSWLLTGGIPNHPSGEDFHFGNLVAQLEGNVAATNRYCVFQLIRISERAGMSSHGRKVKKISQAIIDYFGGQKEKVLIADSKLEMAFANALLLEAEVGVLTAGRILELMGTYGCRTENIRMSDLADVAKGITEEMHQPLAQRSFLKLESWVMEYLGDRMPVQDVTHMV